jgi:hypothetical protein
MIAKGIAMSARVRTFTAALVLGLLSSASAAAGDGTPAVIVHANGACTACEVVPTATTRMHLSGEHRLHKHLKPLPPRDVMLCPGGCFGYFPTQWRSWEEACGLPSTLPPNPGFIPAFPPSYDATPGKNGRAPDPRQVDPMKTKSGIAPLNSHLAPISRIN